MSASLTRGDVLWLVGEIHKTDRQINAGARDRYLIGRRNGLATTACRLLRIDSAGFNSYMKWVHEQIASGKRVGDLEEPASWIRKNG